MEKEKLRSEVDPQDQWDLTTLFATREEWLQSCLQFEQDCKQAYDLNRLFESANTLYAFLTYNEQLYCQIEQLACYAIRKYDIDPNSENQKDKQKIYQLDNDYQNLLTHFIAQLQQQSWESIISYEREKKELKKYHDYLNKLYESEKCLNTETQIALNCLYALEQNPLDLTNGLRNQLQIETITIGKKQLPVTETTFPQILLQSNLEIQKEAFVKLIYPYQKFQDLFGATMNEKIQIMTKISELEGYSSVKENVLTTEKLNFGIYDNLINIVHEFLSIRFQFEEFKMKMINHQHPSLLELSKPLFANDKQSYQKEEAMIIVKHVLAIYGEEYLKIVDRIFEEQWIDWTVKKKNGAYTSNCIGHHPYIYLNFDGTFQSVKTLIHEIGHAVHFEFVNQNNEIMDTSISILVTEVMASINELLLYQYMIDHAQEAHEKMYFEQLLIQLYHTKIFDVTLNVEFEDWMYTTYHDEGMISSSDFTTKYLSLFKEYHHKNIEIETCRGYNWMRIRHYWDYLYYQYQYPISLLLAIKLVNQIQQDPQSYLSCLKLGGQHTTVEQLRTLDIDLSQKEWMIEAFHTIETLQSRWIEDYKKENINEAREDKK